MLLLVIGLLLCAALPIWGQDEVNAAATVKVVVVTGVGAGKQEAIANGQRLAVTQCLSLYMKSDVQDANAKLLHDKVYADVSQYVQDYKEIAESTTADGQISVSLSVQVRMGQVESSMDDLCDSLKVAGNPRIIVDVSPPAGADAPGVAQQMIIEKLVDIGFKVLDETQIKLASEKDALKLIRDGHADAASIKALQDRADIVISGTTTTRPQDTGTQAFSCQSTVAAQSIRVDTAQIVSAARGKGNKADFTADGAAESAQELAADDWVTKNLPLLVRAIVDPCKEYTLEYSGCEHADVIALSEKLAALPTVRKTDLVAFDTGLAQISVQYQGNILKLSEDIAACNGVKVEGTDNLTIRLKKVAGR